MADSPSPNANRSTMPLSQHFKQHILTGWAKRTEELPPPAAAASAVAKRRKALSDGFPRKRIIVPAGIEKNRANDTFYPFRAHSAFAYLTGWGSATVPGAVLVLEPGNQGHEATLYFSPSIGHETEEFYANPQDGEFWAGPRPTLTQVASLLQIATRDAHELSEILQHTDTETVIIRDADPKITSQIDTARMQYAAEQALSTNAGDTPFDVEPGSHHDSDELLAQTISEMRLVKDGYELAEIRQAVAETAAGFTDVITALPQALAHERGERILEGAFSCRARSAGNGVGYESIVAAGSHATILHWNRNNGPVCDGDLVLMDAGVELDSYYTADITRTVPVNGRFSPEQRRVYEAVLAAADAAFDVVRPGVLFREVHEAAMAIIAARVAEWGLPLGHIPVPALESGQLHRRYMVHGTSHHLGLDVHDCAAARRQLYLDGVLEPGMVFTIEPGLYFHTDDLTVPEEYRGIGVRIEDDILVTESGAENLSAAIPRTVDEVEAWVQKT